MGEMGGGGWQEGGGETQITLNVLHRNTYDTKNPPKSAVREENQETRKRREQQKTNEMRDCA